MERVPHIEDESMIHIRRCHDVIYGNLSDTEINIIKLDLVPGKTYRVNEGFYRGNYIYEGIVEFDEINGSVIPHNLGQYIFRSVKTGKLSCSATCNKHNYLVRTFKPICVKKIITK